jgi:ribosomal protein L19E
MNPCEQILKRIRELKRELERREAELAVDRYDLFRRAYSRTPGGALRGKGTYTGHIRVIEGYRARLMKEIVKAKKMRCL